MLGIIKITITKLVFFYLVEVLGYTQEYFTSMTATCPKLIVTRNQAKPGGRGGGEPMPILQLLQNLPKVQPES